MQSKQGQRALFGRQNAVYWPETPITGTSLYTNLHLPYPYYHQPKLWFYRQYSFSLNTFSLQLFVNFFLKSDIMQMTCIWHNTMKRRLLCISDSFLRPIFKYGNGNKNQGNNNGEIIPLINLINKII